MKYAFLICFLPLTIEQSRAQDSPDTIIVLNEIMYASPVSTNNEFIELYNTSETLSMDLRFWQISGATTSPLTLSDTGNGQTILSPKSYALIFPSTYFTGSARYFLNMIPVVKLVLKASAALSLNNDGDSIVITNSLGAKIVEMRYNGGGATGFSLEKRIPEVNNSASNFQQSRTINGTPGSRNSRYVFERNLLISSVSTIFSAPNVSVSIPFSLKNIGRVNFGNGTEIKLYEDRNRNNISEPNEQTNSIIIQSDLLPNDSVQQGILFNSISTDSSRLILTLNNLQDEDSTDNRAVLNLYRISQTDTQIILSEIMYNAPVNALASDEFIELFNTSETDTIDLMNWKIGDVSQSQVISDTGTGLSKLAPKQFALIFTGGNASQTFHYYKSVIPAGTLLLKSANSIALNNSGLERVVLINSRGDTIAQTIYIGTDSKKGYSLEKIFQTRNDDSSNYSYSLRPIGSPGSINSITPKQRDLKLRVNPKFSAQPNALINIPFAVINFGLQPFGNKTTFKVYEDRNQNGVGESNEEIKSGLFNSNIPPKDSVTLSFSYQVQSINLIQFILRIDNSADEDTLNNTASTWVEIGSERNSIIINEILYQPIQDANDGKPDQPDFIELYNRSGINIDLRNWSLQNLPNERGEFDRYLFAGDSSQSYVINANEYAVVSPDRSLKRDSTRLVLYYTYLKQDSTSKLFFVTSRSTFSNSTSGGLVKLIDQTGATIDSVRYSPQWHNPFFTDTRGISLERINLNLESNDKRNWSSSTNRIYGGSPAKKNSVFAASFNPNGASSVEVNPNPFSPDSDGRDDFCVVRYSLGSNINRVRVRIYDAVGRLVRTLANSEPSGSSGELIWDGLGENRESLRIGIYIILVEALDANSASVQSFKKTVVLARRLN